MEKTITVHVIKSQDQEYICASKGKAQDAVDILNHFGVAVEHTTEKRKVKLAD